MEMVLVVGQATSGLDSLITLEDLERSQASDLADIFKADPTVSVGGPVGMSQKIYVRNIGEDQINELDADGKHVHTYNDDWLRNMKEEYFNSTVRKLITLNVLGWREDEDQLRAW